MQKLKFQTETSLKLIYNKRKLNELLNTILMLKNVEIKMQYLIEFIYLNYPFMHAKAEFKSLEFINEIHEYVSSLYEKLETNQTLNNELKSKIGELFELSAIYKTCQEQAKTYPDLLLFEMTSKIPNNFNLIEIFQKSLIDEEFSLIPLQTSFKLVKNNDEQVVYEPAIDQKIEHFDIYWCYDSSYSLVRCEIGQSYVFKVMNHANSKEIMGEIEIHRQQNTKGKPNFTPYFNVKPKSLTNISDIDGGIIYCDFEEELNISHIHLKTFQNRSFEIAMRSFEIKDVFLVSLKCILVRYVNSFEIMHLNNLDNVIICNELVYKEEIFDIQSTMVTKSREFHELRDVYMPEYDQLDYTVLVIIFARKIQVMKFDKIKNLIETNYAVEINYDYSLYYRHVDNQLINCLIDNHFTIQSILTKNQLNEFKSLNQQEQLQQQQQITLGLTSQVEFIRLLTFNGIVNKFGGYQIDENLKMSVVYVYLDFNNKNNSSFTTGLKYNLIDLMSEKHNLFYGVNEVSKFYANLSVKSSLLDNQTNQEFGNDYNDVLMYDISRLF